MSVMRGASREKHANLSLSLSLLMRLRNVLVPCCVLLLAGALPAPPDSPVADAAMRRDRDAVRALLQNGADVNAAQGDGMTALHWAAGHGDVELANMLLYAGARVDAVTRNGNYTPLHLAGRAGNAQVVGPLLKAGADPNAPTSSGGATPLHFAAAQGDPATVAALLAGGAAVDRREAAFGQTPLMWAAANDRTAAMSVLLEHGADLDLASHVEQIPDRENELRTQQRARNARVTAIRNADRPPQAEQPAGRGGRGERAQSADSTAERPAGGRGAAAGERQDRAEAAAGAAAERRDSAAVEQRDTAAAGQRDAAAAAEQRDTTAAAEKRDTAAAAEARDTAAAAEARDTAATAEQRDAAAAATSDSTAAAKAGEEKKTAAAETKPAADAEPADAKPAEPTGPVPENLSYSQLVGGKGGLTPLLFAIREGNTAAAIALLDAGADVNQVSEGDHTSPLLMATINGHFDLATLLLERGADPNLASDLGATPLYTTINVEWAPKSLYPQPTAQKQQTTTYLELMDLLLTAGADVNARLKNHLWFMSYNFDLLDVNTAGATAFWRAAYATDVQAMKLLLAAGADPTVPTLKPAGGRRGRSDDSPDDDDEPELDPSGLPPVSPGGPGVYPIHAASGVGYGEGYAANAHRHVPDGWLPAVRFLIEELGADVNARDLNGYTPLHHAAARGDNELILYLVEKGADVTAVSRRGQTTADMANGPVQRVSPFPETVALLEKLGAKNNNNCKSC
jgi:uncharacterized protein